MRVGSPRAYHRVGWLMAAVAGAFPGVLVGWNVRRLLRGRVGSLDGLLLFTAVGAALGAVCGFMAERTLKAHWQQPDTCGGPYADESDTVSRLLADRPHIPSRFAGIAERGGASPQTLGGGGARRGARRRGTLWHNTHPEARPWNA